MSASLVVHDVTSRKTYQTNPNSSSLSSSESESEVYFAQSPQEQENAWPVCALLLNSSIGSRSSSAFEWLFPHQSYCVQPHLCLLFVLFIYTVLLMLKGKSVHLARGRGLKYSDCMKRKSIYPSHMYIKGKRNATVEARVSLLKNP